MNTSLRTVCLLVPAVATTVASEPFAGSPYAGFSRKNAGEQRRIEARIVQLADADQIAQIARALAAKPHIAGTPAQADTRDFVTQESERYGLRSEVAEYEVFLPFPTRIELERLAPDPAVLPIREPPVESAPASAHELPFPPNHGYAATGEVSGELVYVNYGREADLDQLRDAGVGIEGKIAIARYGRVYRGRKVQNVQERGAIGCLIYSDPRDDGYHRGDVYPKGPMRPEHGIQRGSVKFGAPGDPTTPGYASLPGVERVRPEDSVHLPSIPSTPIGYATAAELLEHLDGAEAPDGWQGSLPFRYHLGPGPTRVRLKIERDEEYRKIWNTFGRIEGAEFPDEWIILGGHRDAWCAGAADNVSGISILLEAARVCAAIAKAGDRPRRTLIFATWDAEEWGIIGSAEWVEQHRQLLRDRVVAYINQDMVITGPNFGGAASPSLAPVLAEVVKAAPHPDEADRSVYDVWAAGKDEPGIGVPGGGSDHAPFFLHLGLPCAGYGFGGKQGIYHSRYDTPDWMERFGDPGYKRHRANAIITSAFALRLANADVLPLDHTRYADKLIAELEKLKPRFDEREAMELFDKTMAAADRFEQGAIEFRALMDRSALDQLDTDQLRRINRSLRRVEPLLTRFGDQAELPAAAGFYQNLIFGLAAGGGYRQQVMPGIHTALEQADGSALATEVELLANRLQLAVSEIETAKEAVRGAGG